jgi:hypothetical protein
MLVLPPKPFPPNGALPSTAAPFPLKCDGEQKANLIAWSAMARRPERVNDALSERDLKQLRENLSRLSPQGVRDFYDRAHEDCRLIYTRLPSPRKIQTLVQVWKQLWKWRR